MSSHAQWHTNLRVTARAKEERSDSPYSYFVTSKSASHTAFRTLAALQRWMFVRGLETYGVMEERGAESQSCQIRGVYRSESHMDHDSFNSLHGIVTRQVDNGRYTRSLITTDPSMTRTVHTLNPNVTDRVEFDHAESRQEEDRPFVPPFMLPKAGDAVRVWGGSGVDDGSVGVLEGRVGGQGLGPVELVVFNLHGGQAFRNDFVVDASGGPAIFCQHEDLMNTDFLHTMYFWKWLDTPRAGGGMSYRLDVPLWDWYPSKNAPPTL